MCIPLHKVGYKEVYFTRTCSYDGNRYEFHLAQSEVPSEEELNKL